MSNAVKSGLAAIAFGAIIGMSAFASAEAAPVQQHVVKQEKKTTVRHDPRTTGSVDSTSRSMPYQYSPRKPLNMDCSLHFNPTSSSSCNY